MSSVVNLGQYYASLPGISCVLTVLTARGIATRWEVGSLSVGFNSRNPVFLPEKKGNTYILVCIYFVMKGCNRVKFWDRFSHSLKHRDTSWWIGRRSKLQRLDFAREPQRPITIERTTILIIVDLSPTLARRRSIFCLQITIHIFEFSLLSGFRDST